MSNPIVAIITGAGSGVGRDTALLLAERGYSLVLVGRTKEKLESTAQTISEQTESAQTLVLPADVAAENGPKSIIDQTLERFGRIDALINNAGYAVSQPIIKTDMQTWRKVIDINVTGPIMLTTLALPVMQEQKSGVIVNISSLAAYDPFPGFGLYAPAKAALTMFTTCTGREAKKIGVRTVGLALGAVETDMLRGMFNEKMLPTDKTLDPMTVASIIRDCVTGEREFQNGETIKVPSP